MGGPVHKMTEDVRVGLQGFMCCAKQLHGGTDPDTKGLLGTLCSHGGAPSLGEESCI